MRRLVHPVPLLAAAVLVTNDFVLKRAVPSALTGKLSDVAGLFLAPLVLAALALAVRPGLDRRRVIAGVSLAVGLVFALAKTLPLLLGLSVPWVPDPTDLAALAVLPLAFAHAVAERGSPFADRLARRPLARLAALTIVAGATIATPMAQGVRRYPAWETSRPIHVVGGTKVAAWVSRSTREGFGLSIDLDCAPGAVPVAIDARETFVRLGGERLRPIEVLPARAEPGGRARGYLAFEFANGRAWNDGVRHATLRLALRVGDGRRDLAIDLLESRPSPHGRAEVEVGP